MKTRKCLTIEVRSEGGQLRCPVSIAFDAIGDRQKEVCRKAVEAAYSASNMLGHDIISLLNDVERADWLNALGGAGMSELVAEIQHGRKKWGGRSPDVHDDGHSQDEWEVLIIDKIGQAASSPPMEWRYRMLQVASLAMSAVRSFDRKNASPPPSVRKETTEKSEATQ